MTLIKFCLLLKLFGCVKSGCKIRDLRNKPCWCISLPLMTTNRTFWFSLPQSIQYAIVKFIFLKFCSDEVTSWLRIYKFLVVYWLLCSCIIGHIHVVFYNLASTCPFWLSLWYFHWNFWEDLLGFPIFSCAIPTNNSVSYRDLYQSKCTKPCLTCPLNTSPWFWSLQHLVYTMYNYIILYIYVTAAHFILTYNSLDVCFISQIWE
jgi:hypothetical protein